MHVPKILEQTNPLSSLTESRLASLLLQGQQGDLCELQWLYFHVEKGNATVRAVKRKLTNALLKLDWDIRVREDLKPEQEAIAEKQRDALRSAYDGIGNLRDALTHLALADLRGFAHCEKVYAGALQAPEPDKGIKGDPRYKFGSWDVVELRIVEPWFWSREGCRWRYNPEARSGTGQGTLLLNPKRDWVIREVGDPADEIFAKAHLDMLLALDDWAQHNDVLAVAPKYVEGPPNASPDQEKEFQKFAEAIVSDGSGYVPNGAKVHLLSQDGAHAAFLARLEYWQKEIVLTGTNGLLTMLAQSGSGTLAGGAHSDTWEEVASGLAALVSGTLQVQFDAQILEQVTPGQPALAYFEFAAVQEEDAKGHLENAKLAKEAGYRIKPEELSEKTGYDLQEAAAPVAGPGGTAAGMSPKASATPGLPPATSSAVKAEPAPVVPTLPGNGPDGPHGPDGRNGQPATERTPIARPSRAGEAEPSIVRAAVADYAGLEEKWLAPVKALLDEVEAAILDPAKTDAEIVALLDKAQAQLPDLLPKMDVAALIEALENAGTPGAIQGVRDALAAKTAKTGVKTGV